MLKGEEKMDLYEATKKISRIINSFRGLLSDVGINNLMDLVNAAEFRVALENLFELIVEDNITIDKNIYLEMEKLGKKFGVDEEYWHSLLNRILK